MNSLFPVNQYEINSISVNKYLLKENLFYVRVQYTIGSTSVKVRRPRRDISSRLEFSFGYFLGLNVEYGWTDAMGRAGEWGVVCSFTYHFRQRTGSIKNLACIFFIINYRFVSNFSLYIVFPSFGLS